jgi:hypothetical protein
MDYSESDIDLMVVSDTLNYGDVFGERSGDDYAADELAALKIHMRRAVPAPASCGRGKIAGIPSGFPGASPELHDGLDLAGHPFWHQDAAPRQRRYRHRGDFSRPRYRR